MPLSLHGMPSKLGKNSGRTNARVTRAQRRQDQSSADWLAKRNAKANLGPWFGPHGGLNFDRIDWSNPIHVAVVVALLTSSVGLVAYLLRANSHGASETATDTAADNAICPVRNTTRISWYTKALKHMKYSPDVSEVRRLYPDYIQNALGGDKALSQVPVFDIKDNSPIGATSYLDNIQSTDMAAPVMRGVDSLSRPFISFCFTHPNSTDPQIERVQTLFQRYPERPENMPHPNWVLASTHTEHPTGKVWGWGERPYGQYIPSAFHRLRDWGVFKALKDSTGTTLAKQTVKLRANDGGNVLKEIPATALCQRPPQPEVNPEGNLPKPGPQA